MWPWFTIMRLNHKSTDLMKWTIFTLWWILSTCTSIDSSFTLRLMLVHMCGTSAGMSMNTHPQVLGFCQSGLSLKVLNAPPPPHTLITSLKHILITNANRNWLVITAAVFKNYLWGRTGKTVFDYMYCDISERKMVQHYLTNVKI